MTHPNVVVVMTRCLRGGSPFGIRFEEKEGRGAVWVATWAFRLRESVGRREGYDQVVTGSFDVGGEYPGCPYCESRSFVSCGSCHKLCCWDGRAPSTTCTWCGYTAAVSGSITSLASRGDV